MDDRKLGYIFWSVLISVVAGLSFYASTSEGRQIADTPAVNAAPRASRTSAHADDVLAGSILFVGDVMLSRGVESYMDALGYDYPFRYVTDLFERYDQVVGNLEGIARKDHVQTPKKELIFSIDVKALPALARAGFTLMTLANNHSFDYGGDAYDYTLTALGNLDVGTAGHPRRVTRDDVAFLDLAHARVAIVPVHAVNTKLDVLELQRLVRGISKESDFQILSVHWGTEYVLHGDADQQYLARRLIDAGIDAVIGHHPHVVQHVEMYRGVPIFYSLGNFVFDQYWSDEVQQGLAVGLEVKENSLTYSLIPIESTQSVPQVMDRIDRARFLNDLAARSDESLSYNIVDGALTLGTRTLASSPDTAMIDTY